MAFDRRSVTIDPNVSSSSNDSGPLSNDNNVSFPVGSKAAKICQPAKRQKLSTEEFEKIGDLYNEEELRTLEKEISDLQEYNARVESEMIRQHTEISQMEQLIVFTERDNLSLSQKNNEMSEYYETLKNDLIVLLHKVKLPNFDEGPTRENFDSYLNQLQMLCTENSQEENKELLSLIKESLTYFNFSQSSLDRWCR